MEIADPYLGPLQSPNRMENMSELFQRFEDQLEHIWLKEEQDNENDPFTETMWMSVADKI